MGRKIPAKKHRGVKDPLEQQARRLQSVKSKINAPPTDPDEQPVPRSLQRLFAPRAPPRARPHLHTPNHGNQTKGIAGGGRGNPVSRLRTLPGESAREFSRRITGAARALRGAGPLHYPGDDDEDEEDSKGARMAELRERRARKQKRAAARRPPPPSGGPAPPSASAAQPALSRTQKLALKRKAKKEKADEKCEERREVQFERVAFGDVAHAPPALRPLRGLAGAPPPGASRPGRRGLLLSALLPGGAAEGGAPSAAEAQRRERARSDAVAAYRALKAERARNSARRT